MFKTYRITFTAIADKELPVEYIENLMRDKLIPELKSLTRLDAIGISKHNVKVEQVKANG